MSVKSLNHPLLQPALVKLPQTIKNCYVVSALGCKGNTVDGFHFSTEGARELGKRDGRRMYSLIKASRPVNTGIKGILSVDKGLTKDVFAIDGKKIGCLNADNVVDNLSRGLYIIGGKCVYVQK